MLLSANNVGLRVNNLFQLDNGTWQANLRALEPDTKDMYDHEFGHGATPKAALAAAYVKAGCEVTE